MPTVAKESDIAATGWGADGNDVLIYTQDANGDINEAKLHNEKWYQQGVVAQAKMASPIALSSNGRDFIRVFYVTDENTLHEAYKQDKEWKTLDSEIKLHPQSRLAARYDKYGPKVYAQAEDGYVIQIGRNESGWEIVRLGKAYPGSTIAALQGSRVRVYFVEYIKLKLKIEGSRLPDVTVPANWFADITGLSKVLPDVKMIEARPGNTDEEWITEEFSLARKKPNMQIAAVDLGAPGLRVYVASGNKVSERVWSSGSWKTSGFDKEISPGPVGTAVVANGRVYVFAHDLYGSERFCEWNTDDGLDEKRAVYVS